MASESDSRSSDGLTRLLEKAAAGDRRAFDDAFSHLYRELEVLARAQRRRLPGNETLDTTALVHEAWAKLAGPNGGPVGGSTGPRWENRRHFFALAAKTMRHILVNDAERRWAAKRGGGAGDVTLGDEVAMAPEAAADVLALHEALGRLAAIDERQVKVVECRFFAGLSIEETAEALAISPATVKRDWQMASAWLYRELRESGSISGP